MRLLLSLLAVSLLSSVAARAEGPRPVKVKVEKVMEKLPCKCEGPEGVAASKVKSERCFLSTDIKPLEPVEPFSKMFLLMNQVKGRKTIVQVPDAKECKFAKGRVVKLWSTDLDTGFLQSTPTCGREYPGYGQTCEPYGRFIVLFRSQEISSR